MSHYEKAVDEAINGAMHMNDQPLATREKDAIVTILNDTEFARAIVRALRKRGIE